MVRLTRFTLWLIIPILLLFFIGCGDRSAAKPEKLPDDPVQRAALLGLYSSYGESTMWEVQKAKVLSVMPMVPSKVFVQQHDPDEVYCVCIEYEARYRVPWTTKDRSEWELTIRNILVMKSKAGEYMAMSPSGICPALCR